MPIAKLEFDLNDSDDAMAHLRAVKSTDMAMALWNIVYNTKKSIYNQIESNKLDSYDAVDKVFESIWEIMNEHGIILDDLIN